MAEDVSPDGRSCVLERTETGNFDICVPRLWMVRQACYAPPGVFEKTRSLFPGPVHRLHQQRGRAAEVYVRPFRARRKSPRLGRRGRLLRWGATVRSTTFRARCDSSPCRSARARAPGRDAETLFTVGERGWIDFDLSADAQRILAIVPEIVGDESPLNVPSTGAPTPGSDAGRCASLQRRPCRVGHRLLGLGMARRLRHAQEHRRGDRAQDERQPPQQARSGASRTTVPAHGPIANATENAMV